MKNTYLQLATICTTLLVIGLAGCGGGSSTTDGNTIANIASIPGKTIPEFVTVPEYQALRAEAVVVTGGDVLTAQEASALLADNQHLAASQLNAQLRLSTSTYGGNQAVAPPLTYAVVRTLGAAAKGDSLAQITRAFNLIPTPFVAAQQTSRVTSQFWADKGHQFHTTFMVAEDTLGPFARLVNWLASEFGFASGVAVSDAALAAALVDSTPYNPNSSSSSGIGDLTKVRLLASHSIRPSANWPAVTAFDGVFQGDGANNYLRLPMVRVAQGVTQYSGADFTAQMLKDGDLRVMTIRPSAATLTEFANGRLESALAEATQTLLGTGATPASGDMLLPQVDMQLRVEANGPVDNAGVSLVYDEVNANLQGLDVGGIYVKMARPWASLKIAGDGLTLQAAHSLAFVFSPRNIFGSLGSGGVVFSVTAVPNQTCVWPVLVPDLRPFFLVILDGRGWVVSMAAIQAPPGVQVQPVCTPNFVVVNPIVPGTVTPTP